MQTRCMFHKCPPVLVPDTILLDGKLPCAWYRTQKISEYIFPMRTHSSRCWHNQILAGILHRSRQERCSGAARSLARKKWQMHCYARKTYQLIFPVSLLAVQRESRRCTLCVCERMIVVCVCVSCACSTSSNNNPYAAQRELFKYTVSWICLCVAGCVYRYISMYIHLYLCQHTQPITEFLSPAGLDYFLNAPVSKRTRAGLVQVRWTSACQHYLFESRAVTVGLLQMTYHGVCVRVCVYMSTYKFVHMNTCNL